MPRRRIKQAGIMDGLKAGLRSMADNPVLTAAFAAPLMGMGARAIENRINTKRDAAQKQLSYKEMMQLHPHFKEHDQTKIVRVFNSLHNMSPQVAKDPMLAGAYVDQILADNPYGQTSVRSLIPVAERLSGVNKNLSDVARNTGGTPNADRFETFANNFGKLYADNSKNVISKMRQEEVDDWKGVKEDAIQNLLRARQEQFQLRKSQIHQREKELGATHFKFSSARTSLGAMLAELKV